MPCSPSGDLPNPGIKPRLPHCRQILDQLSHKGSPRIVEWVSYTFSSGSSLPGNQTGVSCIAGRIFTTRATFGEGHSAVSDSLQPHELYSPWNSLSQNTRVGSFSLLPNPGIELRSPALQADSLPAEPQGKPKNIVVGSLSFLQQIFLTQELNQGLLHYRLIIYELSYQ